jgi:ABC-2 type transport system ATP-binding protein
VSAPDNGADLLTVTGLPAARIGEIAAGASVVLHELTPQASLEEAFMELTSGSVEFGRSEQPGQPSQPDPVNATQGGAR